jgi:hypothetical protein
MDISAPHKKRRSSGYCDKLIPAEFLNKRNRNWHTGRNIGKRSRQIAYRLANRPCGLRPFWLWPINKAPWQIGMSIWVNILCRT